MSPLVSTFSRSFPFRRAVMICAAVAATVVTVLAPGATAARAADGDLDPSFEGDGLASIQVSSAFDDVSEDMLVLLEGSVLLAGSTQVNATDHDFMVVKLKADGTYDTAFGNNGVAVTFFDLGGGDADHATALARQSDGKLVVGGFAETSQAQGEDFAVARFLADGTLDIGFGNFGKVSYAVDLGGGHRDILTDVLVQPDGKIVLVGWASRGNGDQDFVAVRLLASGAVDTGFGSGGEAVVAFNRGGFLRDSAEAAVLQPDGKIVLVGSAEFNGFDYDFAAARLTAGGSLDPGFGAGGRVTVHFDRGGSKQDLAEAATLDGAGRLVMVGRSEGVSHLDMDFAIVRLLTSGLLDTSFSVDGKTTVGIDVGHGFDQATGVAMAPSDKIVVAGRAHVTGANVDFAAVRLHPGGAVDTSFGQNGRARVAFDLGGSLRDDPTAMAIGIDGGIYLSGPAQSVSQRVLVAVAKLQGAPWFVLP
ncbi:MAG: hypothetical protein AAGM22_02520 [Acidobacteriota bacterium]